MGTALPNKHSLRSRLKTGQRPRLPGDLSSYITSSVFGEPPASSPMSCYERGELVEKIVHLAENLTLITPIGSGGTGRTYTVLIALRGYRIRRRFGRNRWIVYCDRFPASCVHFLHQLSEVTGAGIEGPDDPDPLRSFLSSKEMMIVLDNAESILDPQRMSAEDIYAVVKEPGQFNNICLCITSRISIVPPDYETLNIPTLSVSEAACDTFYHVYRRDERSDRVNSILEQLDFHPLPITLLATVAKENKWGASRLNEEWERQRTQILRTSDSNGLAAAIEHSLASLTFQGLGPDTRGPLGVITFFPQGVDGNSLDRLFPTTSNVTGILHVFCVLSLAYRNNGFVTMLAPFRGHLHPEDPKSSQLLSMIKESYFTRLSVDLYPGRPRFKKARWIASEIVNVEHLLNIFTSIDTNSDDVWDACANSLKHLYWHKKQLITLGPKIGGLPDGHRSKSECLFELL